MKVIAEVRIKHAGDWYNPGEPFEWKGTAEERDRRIAAHQIVAADSPAAASMAGPDGAPTRKKAKSSRITKAAGK